MIDPGLFFRVFMLTFIVSAAIIVALHDYEDDDE